MKKLPLIAVGIISLVVILFIGFLAYIDYREKTYQPKFFSLDNPKAQYSIGKWPDGLYTVKYDGREHNKEYGFTTAEVLVGTSKVELNSYVGKNVRIFGRFPDKYNKQQCIVNKCTPINAVSVDIDKIN